MINIRGLTKYYGEFCAVDRIDLDIAEGEILGLLGPNGAGKTTTLRMLTGFIAPSEGDVMVNGMSIRSAAPAVKRLMGYLPESAPLYPAMLVYDFLCFVAKMRGIPASSRFEAVSAMASLCALEDVMHLPVSHLSKGLRQRVGLAQAMLADPEILVLDEPTSGLDPNQIVEIRRIIKGIGSSKTVILSTHILSEVEATCDRIVIINKGRIIADGSAEQLRNETPSMAPTVRLEIEAAPWEDARQLLEDLEVVQRVELVEDDSPGPLKINVTCAAGLDPRPALYAAIKQTDWILLEMHRPSHSLETIFRHLTREATQ